MNINDLKKQYESINASKSLRNKVNREIKKSRLKNGFKRSGCIAATFIVAFGVAVNASPAFADAMVEIPVIAQLVRVITLRKYENSKYGYSVKVEIPQIEGLGDAQTQDMVNKEFSESGREIIDDFETITNEIYEQFGDENRHMGATEYNYEVKTDTEDILAIDTYYYFTGGSSAIFHRYHTFDKHTGKEIEFAALFKEGADYITPISEYISEEMKRINAEEGGMYSVGADEIDGFTEITEDVKFYLNSDKNIVICFDKYEHAAGAQGSSEFVIPNEVVEAVLAD